MTPETTIVAASTTVTSAAMPSPRRETEEDGVSGGMRFSEGDGKGRRLRSSVEDAEDHRDEHQRRTCSKNQATDDGAAERRVLLAAVAEAERGRRHADDHGERG